MTAQAHPSHRVSRAVTELHSLLDDISDVSLWSMGTDETAHTLTEITRAASRVAELLAAELCRDASWMEDQVRRLTEVARGFIVR